MIFSEIYGSYFNAAAKILSRAADEELTEKDIADIVSSEAFGESILNLPAKIKSNDWGLLTDALKTPLKHKPKMPVTLLQKRWLKTIKNDRRINLFGLGVKHTDDVKALYDNDTIIYFDRYGDGDPYDDENYVKNFQTVLKAVKNNRLVKIKFISGNNTVCEKILTPYRIEYSSQDDKFRLIAASKNYLYTINMARVKECRIHDASDEIYPPLPEDKKEIVMELTDERNALERAMIHFSYLEKKTERIDDNRYRVTLRYDKEDESDILIRVMAFGPMIKVTEPESFIGLIRERLIRQKNIK